jgi:hypothetical protein
MSKRLKKLHKLFIKINKAFTKADKFKINK